MNALKPCPFCGNQEPFVDGHYYVSCNNPDCIATLVSLPTEAEAIAAWNRRAASTGRETREALEDDEILTAEFHAELRKQGAFSVENYGTVALAMHPFIVATLNALDRRRALANNGDGE